jgi:Ca2+-binding RTX toxin-like protein
MGDIDVPNQGWRIIQRLQQDGAADKGFGERSWAVFEDGSDHPMAGLLEAGDQGKVTVSFGGVLMRLLENGKRDKSFGNRGRAPTGTSGLIQRNNLNLRLGDGVITQDHIYLAGSATHSRRSGGRWSVVIRLNLDGMPDPTFSNDGLAARKIGPFVKFSLLERRIGMLSGRLLVDGSGRTIVGATGGAAENLRFTLSRFQGGKGKRLSCDGEPATVQGTPGDDRLAAGAVTVTGPGDDVVNGGGKLICTGGGDDKVESWEAGKVLLGSGDDRFSVNSIGGEVYGEDGNDRIFGRNMLADGGAGDDLIDTTRPRDPDWSVNDKRLIGGPGRDRLISGRGKDRLYGGPGPDVLRSGLEEDSLFGGPGNDSLFGEEAADLLVGGPGMDRLDGGPAGPDYRRYWANNRRVRGLIEVLPDRIGRVNLKFKTTCSVRGGSPRKYWESSYVLSEGMKIRNGRFGGSFDFDTGYGYAGDERTSGTVTSKWITVTIHRYEDQVESTTCTARNLKLRLKRIRPLEQILRQ